MLIECDDKISVISEKTKSADRGIKIGLNPKWRLNPYVNKAYDRNGDLVIHNYYNPSVKDSNISISDYEELTYSEKQKFIPNCEWIFELPQMENAYIRLLGNHIRIIITKLSYGSDEMLLSRRYRKIVELLDSARPAIIKYENKGGNERSKLESSRNILLRWFRLHEYEYNIIFPDREQGRAVFEELKVFSKTHMTDKNGLETIYLKGQGKSRGQTIIKMYDLGFHSQEDTGIFKIEVTLKRSTFVKGVTDEEGNKKRIDIRDMTEQENCIELLRCYALKEIHDLKGGEMVKDMKNEIMDKSVVMARIIRIENSVVKLSAEQNRQNEEVNKLRKDIEKLAEKTGLTL
jgi:hypothetical protein